MAEYRDECSCNVDTFYPYVNEDNEIIGIFCPTCCIEWVSRALLNEENQNMDDIKERNISWQDQKLTFCMKKKFSNLSKNWLPIRREIDDVENVSSHIEVGDHISYRFQNTLQHHAMIADISADGEVTVIHFHGKKGIVRDVLHADSPFIITFGYHSPDSPQLTMARARMGIGRCDYNVLANNCEHFAFFCKMGFSWSWQAYTFWETLIKHVSRDSGPTTAGRVVSSFGGIGYEDMPIYRIEELKPGDHVVAIKWFLHPRCHMIVTGISNCMLDVVRFTFKHGVIEERISLTYPFYKVLYKKGESFEADDVVRRAKEKRNKDLSYGILLNNCKSFARWCKTGRLPQQTGGYHSTGMDAASP